MARLEEPDPRTGTSTGMKKVRRLELLRYRRGDSFLHRLDPRTKLLVLLVVSIAALLFSSLPALALILSFVLALAFASRLASALARALTLVLPLLILVIVLDSIFSKVSSGTVWFSSEIGILHPEITTGGILFAIAMGLRLLTLTGISFLFIMTTSPDDFVRSLRAMRVPVILTFSLGYALRSTTGLADDTRQIMDAQRSRGLELDKGTGLKNWSKLVALFTPVTVSLLKRSKYTADAMQARGFRQSAYPTCYRLKKAGREDTIMVVFLLALALILTGLFWISGY